MSTIYIYVISQIALFVVLTKILYIYKLNPIYPTLSNRILYDDNALSDGI